MTERVFIVGCGYLGKRVAAVELSRGKHVRALARSPGSVASLRAIGVEPVSGDLDLSASLRAIDVSGVLVYYFAPPPLRGTTDARIESFLHVIDLARPPKRLVLVSTTGVYGDCAGAWIDEDSPVNPATDRARRRLAAEDAARAWCARTRVPVTILRTPGIYGPGRLPVERVRKRLPVLREEESPWSNRIHIDDLVAACLAAADQDLGGRIYNVSDGNPTTMTDYFNRLADLLKLARPPQISMDRAREVMGAEILSYLTESRRLRNTRMRVELGVTPRYPTLAAGLAACIDQAGNELQSIARWS
jgi:nucleoside-diphosphate-sugar epimerase